MVPEVQLQQGVEHFTWRHQDEERPEATPIATQPIAKDFPALPHAFFGTLLWGVLVETEAYSQEEPACHGHRRRSPSNETLFGEPGRFYVYVSYGIHYCVNMGS